MTLGEWIFRCLAVIGALTVTGALMLVLAVFLAAARGEREE